MGLQFVISGPEPIRIALPGSPGTRRRRRPRIRHLAAVAGHLGSFVGGERAFRGWFFTIARHRLVQHWRDIGRRPVVVAGPESFAECAGQDDPEARVLALVSAQEAAAIIASALSPDQAEIVLLRILAGLDVDQVAEILNKRPGTIRVLQHRALRRLAKSFSIESLTR